MFCTILYCTVLYLTILYCTILYCTVLYCTVLYCTVLYLTVLYCTVLYCTLLYCTVLHCTVLYCTVLYLTVLYCTVLYCRVFCVLCSNRLNPLNARLNLICHLLALLGAHLIIHVSSIRVFSHAACPAELPVRHISVPDWNWTSRELGRRPAYQFQCNCIGTCTRV